MFLEILVAIAFGILAGIITGLIPGVHINLVSIILLSMAPLLLGYASIMSLGVFIISMAVTHTFLDFIPSVFLGAPEGETALSILPGHRLLLQGRAFEAVKLTVIGSLFCLLLAIVLAPLLFITLGKVYPLLKQYIGIILIIIVTFMITKDDNRFWNATLFFMSGVLGLIVLNMPNLNNPLFPLLSGLFGTSMLLQSLMDKVNVPEQTTDETIVVEKRKIASALGAGTIAGGLTSFFPGLGAAQGAIIASQFTKDIGDHAFMILVGGINTVNFVLSLITLSVIEKARNGAVIVVQDLFGSIVLQDILIFFCATLVVAGIATILALKLTKGFAKVIVKVNYQMLCIGIIAFITLLVFFFSGFVGLLVLLTATAVGMIAPIKGIGRNHAMGCLLLPVILYFII